MNKGVLAFERLVRENAASQRRQEREMEEGPFTWTENQGIPSPKPLDEEPEKSDWRVEQRQYVSQVYQQVKEQPEQAVYSDSAGQRQSDGHASGSTASGTSQWDSQPVDGLERQQEGEAEEPLEHSGGDTVELRGDDRTAASPSPEMVLEDLCSEPEFSLIDTESEEVQIIDELPSIGPLEQDFETVATSAMTDGPSSARDEMNTEDMDLGNLQGVEIIPETEVQETEIPDTQRSSQLPDALQTASTKEAKSKRKRRKQDQSGQLDALPSSRTSDVHVDPGFGSETQPSSVPQPDFLASSSCPRPMSAPKSMSLPKTTSAWPKSMSAAPASLPAKKLPSLAALKPLLSPARKLGQRPAPEVWSDEDVPLKKRQRPVPQECSDDDVPLINLIRSQSKGAGGQKAALEKAGPSRTGFKGSPAVGNSAKSSKIKARKQAFTVVSASTSPELVSPSQQIIEGPLPDITKMSTASSVEDKLAVYRHRVDRLISDRQAKPDMVAYKELSTQITPKDTIGHIKGVNVGLRVNGKGELAILGIHCNICGGIHQKKGQPAFAIALAGGYADDDDSGAEFWYTGQGGQVKGRQTADQDMTKSGNAALKKSHELQTPVRVVRKMILHGQTMPVYIYEGLYLITEALMAQGTEGFQMCRFKMVAIPGESVVSTKVEHGKVPNFKKASLASRSTKILPKRPSSAKSQPLKKRKISPKEKRSTLDDILSEPKPAVPSVSADDLEDAELLLDLSNHIQERTCAKLLLLEDFSRGAEKKPVPVYGDSEEDILLLPKKFTYLRRSETATKAADQVVAWSKKSFRWGNDRCGIDIMGKPHILSDGRLTETLIRGLFECGEECKREECKYNRVVTEGFKYPLEIFKTGTRGWGIRCSTPIPIGSYICEYAGEIVTDSEAEARQHEYLFDLDHFALAEPGTPIIAVLPKDTSERAERGEDTLLTIDGHVKGNLGRFLNHSCEGNVLLQPTFAAGSCPHLYRVAMFAAQDIPAFEELTYHYGWSPREGSNELWEAQGLPTREVWCACGSRNCQGRLL